MKKLRAVIVEDEENAIEFLNDRLIKHCPQVEIVDTCLTAERGVQAIKLHDPDIVFLDIHIGPVNAFDMLERIMPINFLIIIITDHDNYGIEAVKAGATDYLLKPIMASELKAAVKKAEDKKAETQARITLPVDAIVDALQQRTTAEPELSRISIPVSDGRMIVNLDEIVYVEAKDQKTEFFKYKGSFTSPRLLKQVDKALSDYGFFRISRSHIVNLNYVEKHIRTDGGYVIMSNGAKLKIAHGTKLPGLINLD